MRPVWGDKGILVVESVFSVFSFSFFWDNTPLWPGVPPRQVAAEARCGQSASGLCSGPLHFLIIHLPLFIPERLLGQLGHWSVRVISCVTAIGFARFWLV